MGRVAGRQSAFPVFTSNSAPCHSQVTVHSSASSSPLESGKSRCEQLSWKA